MSCSHEHHGHTHDDGDHAKPGEGTQDLLYGSIDRSQVNALNELVTVRRGVADSRGSAAGIIKPYDARMDETCVLESDVDDELLITVPFAGSVKLRALLLRGGPAKKTPRAIHLYKNVESLGFDDASGGSPPATQKLESIPATSELVEIPLLAARFPDVQSVTLYIPGALGGEQGEPDPRTRISFLGFRGEPLAKQRGGPQQIVYEAAPSVADHTKVANAASTRPEQG